MDEEQTLTREMLVSIIEQQIRETQECIKALYMCPYAHVCTVLLHTFMVRPEVRVNYDEKVCATNTYKCCIHYTTIELHKTTERVMKMLENGGIKNGAYKVTRRAEQEG